MSGEYKTIPASGVALRPPTEEMMLGHVPPGALTHSDYGIIVRNYMFGQYRIQLTDARRPDPDAPPGHGAIVRELCTYKFPTMRAATLAMAVANDPEAYCESLANKWNCDGGTGRIRLDTLPGEHYPRQRE